MRTLFYLFSIAILVSFATWSYKVNYATRAAERRVALLSDEITTEMEKIEILKAEWAYLNRPERLLRLAEANFDVLGLGPIAADQTGSVADVAYPEKELEGSVFNAIMAIAPLEDSQ